MNILVGTSSPVDKGAGINTCVKEIIAELRRQSHTILLVGPAPDDGTWLTQHDVKLLPVDENSDPTQAVREIINAVNEYPIDCIINNDNAYVQSVAPAVGCVFISVAHLSRTNIATLATYNHDWIDHLVAISNDMRYRFLRKTKIRASKISLIYNGIQDPVDEPPRKDYQGPLKAVFPGGSAKRKGFDLMLSAIENHPDRWNEFELSIYGKLSDSAKKRLKAYSFVNVIGRVPREQMLDVLKLAHVFLLPSRVEGCPMSLIEAMAYGLVPITSDGEGAMDAMVTSGVNGSICQIDNWQEQMLDCLDSYASNRRLLELHSQMARKEFVERYQVGGTVQKLLALAGAPTVDRRRRASSIDVLKWHRPNIEGTALARFVKKACYKLGVIRKHCSLEIE